MRKRTYKIEKNGRKKRQNGRIFFYHIKYFNVFEMSIWQNEKPQFWSAKN